jgi:heme/copper-type cytochrome/quinol oxidase subunit 2
MDIENFDTTLSSSLELDKSFRSQTYPGRFVRLLEVNNRCILPVKTKMTLLISSSDVLHS